MRWLFAFRHIEVASNGLSTGGPSQKEQVACSKKRSEISMSEADFDISQLDESVQSGVTAFVETQVSGLKQNSHELKGQLKQAKAQASETQAQLADIQKMFGDYSLDDVGTMIERMSALEQGEYDKAMNNEDIKKIVDPVLQRTNAAHQKEKDKITGDYQKQLADISGERDALKESVMRMSFDQRSTDVFTGIANHEPSAIPLVSDQVRKFFTPDAEGNPEAVDEYGEIRLTPKGEAWTLDWFVEDYLPEKFPLFFRQPEGGGATGGSGGGRSIDYGLGISSRQGVSDDLRNKHMEISRSRGVNPTEAWNKIPMFSNGQNPN